MASTITTSRSVLMHASLAHFSPQLQTLDSILRQASQPAAPGIRLPPELLLLIRENLFPIITFEFFQRSSAALKQYESSLRRLLCHECLSYYQDVFGHDIWQWEQFTGPCLCSGTPAQCAAEFATPEYWDRLNPKRQFKNCSEWLEFYLSFEASRLSRRDPFSSIWDAVNGVLHEFNSQLSDPVAPPVNLPQRNAISIIVSEPGRTTRSGGLIPIELHRVNRDLALSYQYQDGLELHRENARRPPCVPPPKPPLAHGPSTRALQAITDLTVSCFNFPVTLATTVLTIFCYVSKPHILRLS